MKAISLWQPWATLIVIGAKQFETRSWSTPYRGRILIHAAKRNTEDERDYFLAFRKVLNDAGYFSFYDLPLGKIIGAATITDMHRTEVIRESISEAEDSYGNYENGRWAWALTNPARLDPAIDCRGMQQIFTVPADVEEQIRKQVKGELHV